jgi:hypothetical protein
VPVFNKTFQKDEGNLNSLDDNNLSNIEQSPPINELEISNITDKKEDIDEF